MILLNPGPVNVSERVRKTLVRPDLCHRESEFDALVQGIRQKLVRAFVPEAESEYTALVLTGSGTAAVEGMVLSSVPAGKRALILNNGVYGERLSFMVGGSHRLGVAELKFDWSTCPDPERVRLALRQHPEVHTVAMVHHETTTGLINPVKEIAQVVDSENRAFVVDSVSGLGGEPLEIARGHLYAVAGTAGKCIQGFPGVSFVIVLKAFMERMLSYPKRSWYLSLANYYESQEKGSVPFTPAVQVYYAFDEALAELLEEGVAARIQRYRAAATRIRERLTGLGIKPLLPAEQQSNSITAFYLPEGVSYQTLHDRLKEQGYIIYAGQGQLEPKIFRVANMGALSLEMFDGFCTAFERALNTAGR